MLIAKVFLLLLHIRQADLSNLLVCLLLERYSEKNGQRLAEVDQKIQNHKPRVCINSYWTSSMIKVREHVGFARV